MTVTLVAYCRVCGVPKAFDTEAEKDYWEKNHEHREAE